MWSTVELREIRVFLTVADELHFGRSAERLSLSPSRVSQIIRGLEAKLGVPLFDRTSRRVSLTMHGNQLRDELRPGVDVISEALQRTQAASGVIGGTLRIGELCGAGGPRFIELIKAFEARHPDCSVTVSEAPWTDAFGPLQRGEVDLLAGWLPIDRPNLAVGPVLKSEPRVLAVACDHPLAARRSVTLEDIADYRVGRIDTLPRELIAELVPFQTPRGRPIPRTSDELRSLAELGAQVALGRIVHPTVPSFDETVGRGTTLTYVPITGLPPSRTGLVWRRDNNDPRVHEFARLTQDILDDGACASLDHRPAGSG